MRKFSSLSDKILLVVLVKDWESETMKDQSKGRDTTSLSWFGPSEV
jgi:hypothetical protein